MLTRNLIKNILYIVIISVFFISCSTKKGLIHTSAKLAPNSKVGVVIDSPNNLKNAVLATFMKQGLRVKAFNASDLYTLKDIYDISDMKKLSYNTAEETVATVSTYEKTYDNIYKLHVYNFELDKASTLQRIRTDWDVDFLIVLDLKDWEHVSWARVINLRTLDIEYIENYPTKYNDNVETIVAHFAKNITGR
jgi:hypothetical protein